AAWVRRSGKVQDRKSLLEASRGIRESRGSGSEAGARGAHRAFRDERFASVVLEGDPSVRNPDHAGAGSIHVERIRAAKIDRRRGRGVHEEVTRRRPDLRSDAAMVERHAMLARTRSHQSHATVRLDVYAADLPYRDPRTR